MYCFLKAKYIKSALKKLEIIILWRLDGHWPGMRRHGRSGPRGMATGPRWAPGRGDKVTVGHGVGRYGHSGPRGGATGPRWAAG